MIKKDLLQSMIALAIVLIAAGMILYMIIKYKIN